MAVSTFKKTSSFTGLAEYTVNFSFEWMSTGSDVSYTAITVPSFGPAEANYAISLSNVDSTSTGAVRVYDASNNLLDTFSPITTAASLFAMPAGVNHIEVDLTLYAQPSITATLLIVERNLTVSNKTVPWPSALKIFQTSGNVTVPAGTYNFLISGAGGGGTGGSFGTGGWPGGGSGYIKIGTVSGGTYPLVVGAGGNGGDLNASGFAPSSGGVTTFNGLTANGGDAGGPGGSGAGGANNSAYSISGTNGGYNGSSGGTGIAGSGYTVPAPWASFTGAGGELQFSPGNTQYLGDTIRQGATGGGFYSGGGGQKGSPSFYLGVATNTKGGDGIYGGGGGAAGGGASNNYSGPGPAVGGKGGSGFLAIITTAI